MKLIDKDAVLARMDNIIADENESIKSFEHGKNVSEVQRSNARIGVLTHLRSSIDSLEVKEIDLEKEMDKEWNKCEPIDEGMGLEIASIEHEQFDNIAKHFFELGLKVQKGE